MTEAETETVLEPSIIPTRKPYKIWDQGCKDRVLRFVAEHGYHHALCAKVAGVSQETLRLKLKDDEEFRDEVDALIDQQNIELEKEARRRAMEGVTRRKYDKDGRILEEEQIYSDALMQKLLEANNPKKFRQQRDQGSASFSGGVLLIPMKGDPSELTDPGKLAARLEDLSSFQDDLRREAERVDDLKKNE